MSIVPVSLPTLLFQILAARAEMSGKSNAPNLPGGHYDPFDDNWETLLDSGQLDAKLDRLVMQAPPPLPIYRD